MTIHGRHYWAALINRSYTLSRINNRYYDDSWMAEARRHFAQRVLWVYFL